jgi:uncharacterized membrane protein YphA (DoxX/SURF4 family)
VDPAIAWILRLGLAVLLATAAFHKASQPRIFVQTLRDYQVLPRALVPFAVPAIVAFEAGLAVALVVPEIARVAALGSGALLIVYSAAIATNLARGRRFIDCGCLGPSARQPLSGWLLARNGALIVASALAALPIVGRPLHWLDAVSIAGGFCVISLLFHATNALATQTASWRRFGRSI